VNDPTARFAAISSFFSVHERFPVRIMKSLPRLTLPWCAVLGLACWMIVGPAHAGDGSIALQWNDHAGLGRLFSEAGVDGTFVSCRQADGVMTGHNSQRAMRRLPPASTFKIPHTLFALESGVVSGPGEMFEWDGAARTFAVWERDMTLADAMRVSNVPVYREVASRIGRARMQKYLESFDYGSREVGESLADFWLVGPLEISAVEQCRFLLRLAAGEMPVAEAQLQELRAMMATDMSESITLYAKTGWATAPEPGPGWWVGWLEGPFGRAAFALNIDLLEAAQAPLREGLGHKALQVLGLLPRPD
jgi:beta-lactamase class D